MNFDKTGAEFQTSNLKFELDQGAEAAAIDPSASKGCRGTGHSMVPSIFYSPLGWDDFFNQILDLDRGRFCK